MKNELINLFMSDEISLSYRNIKRFLGAGKKHVDKELQQVLRDLELEGILYEDDESIYRTVPSNFFVKELKSTRKGLMYVELDDNRFYINNSNLKGALVYDKVLVSVEDGEPKIVKVIDRTFSNLVCEVILIDGVKHLKPLNVNNSIEVIAGSLSMKKLVPGDIALFKIENSMFEGKYDVSLVNVIGKNTDENIEYDIVAYSNGFSPRFEVDAKKEIDNINYDITKGDFEERLDLRNIITFTIDDAGCLDMDDALSIEKDNEGYTLYVHIAHVSHYVKMNSKLFNEAFKRCTSLYYGESSIPMLPLEISNTVCSLNENEDKLARSIIMRFDLNGGFKDFKITKSIIRSNKKMDYNSVENIFNGLDIPGDYVDYVDHLELLRELDDKICKSKSFSICDMESNNISHKYSSHNLVRDYMVMANHLVALYMINKPCIFRNHPIPSDEKIKETLQILSTLGHNINNLSNLNSSILFEKLFKSLKNKDDLLILSNVILSSLKLAYYSPVNQGHFSLGFNDGYVHFTSPIRRFPDLVISNLLDMYEEKELTEEDEKNLKEFLLLAASKSSKMERMAERAQSELEDVSVLKNVKEMIGQNIEAFIEEIHEGYIVVRSKGLMNGIIKMEDMVYDDFKLLPSGKIKSASAQKVYKVGHKLEVQIKDVSFTEKAIYYKEIKNITLEEVEEVKLKKVMIA